jgi:hypothetical protein
MCVANVGLWLKVCLERVFDTLRHTQVAFN